MARSTDQPQVPDSRFAGVVPPGREPISWQTPAGVPLENFLQQWVSAVCDLEETLVRPRWQPQPPNLPAFGTDWCSIGITEGEPIGPYAASIYYPEFEIEQRQRFVEFTMLCSFYGPNCAEYSSALYDSSQVWQNRWMLRTVGVALVDMSGGRRIPELIKEQWWDRIDREVTLRRIIRKNYRIKSLLDTETKVVTDRGYVSEVNTHE